MHDDIAFARWYITDKIYPGYGGTGKEKNSDQGGCWSQDNRIWSPLLYRLSYKARREYGRCHVSANEHWWAQSNSSVGRAVVTSIPTLVSDFLFPCTSGTISTPRANAKVDIGSFITSLYTLMVHFIVMWDTVYVKLSSQCSVCLCFFGFFAVFVSYNLRQRNCVAAVNNGTCNCFLLLCTEQQECNTGVANAPRCTLRPAFGQVLNGVYNTNHCDCPLVG